MLTALCRSVGFAASFRVLGLLVLRCLAPASGSPVGEGSYDACDPNVFGIPKYTGRDDLIFRVSSVANNVSDLVSNSTWGMWFGKVKLFGDGEYARTDIIERRCYKTYDEVGRFFQLVRSTTEEAVSPSVLGRVGVRADRLDVTVSCSHARATLVLGLRAEGDAMRRDRICLTTPEGFAECLCLNMGERDCDFLRAVTEGLHDDVTDYIYGQCRGDVDAMAAFMLKAGAITYGTKPLYTSPFRVNFGTDWSIFAGTVKCSFARAVSRDGSLSDKAVCRASGKRAASVSVLSVSDGGREVLPISRGSREYLLRSMEESWLVVDARALSPRAVCRCYSTDSEKTVAVALPSERASDGVYGWLSNAWLYVLVLSAACAATCSAVLCHRMDCFGARRTRIHRSGEKARLLDSDGEDQMDA